MSRTETVEWITPAGEKFPLDVEWNVLGRFSPPVRIISQEAPGQPGSTFVEAYHGPRVVDLVVWVTARGPADLRDELRRLVYALDATAGVGRLRSTGPDGTTRELYAVPDDVQIPERLGDTSGPNVQRMMVAFRGLDPYWHDAAPITAFLGLVAEGNDFFPIFPIDLSASEVGGTVELPNSGDVEAWPVWTITGPASSIEMTNTTTGETILVDNPVAAGETVTIDTSPGVKTVTDHLGANLMPELSNVSALWSFAPGPNTVVIALVGGTESSSVKVEYRRRWLSV